MKLFKELRGLLKQVGLNLFEDVPTRFDKNLEQKLVENNIETFHNKEVSRLLNQLGDFLEAVGKNQMQKYDSNFRAVVPQPEVYSPDALNNSPIDINDKMLLQSFRSYNIPTQVRDLLGGFSVNYSYKPVFQSQWLWHQVGDKRDLASMMINLDTIIVEEQKSEIDRYFKQAYDVINSMIKIRNVDHEYVPEMIAKEIMGLVTDNKANVSIKVNMSSLYGLIRNAMDVTSLGELYSPKGGLLEGTEEESKPEYNEDMDLSTVLANQKSALSDSFKELDKLSERLGVQPYLGDGNWNYKIKNLNDALMLSRLVYYCNLTHIALEEQLKNKA